MHIIAIGLIQITSVPITSWFVHALILTRLKGHSTLGTLPNGSFLPRITTPLFHALGTTYPTCSAYLTYYFLHFHDSALALILSASVLQACLGKTRQIHISF